MRFINVDLQSYLAMLKLSDYSFQTFNLPEKVKYDIIADSFIACHQSFFTESGEHNNYFLIIAGDVPDPISEACKAEILGIPAKKLIDQEKKPERSRPPEP